MSSRATTAAYAPQQPVSGAGKDNYTAMPSSYGRSSNGRQPIYESPVIPDYDPTTTSHAAGDVQNASVSDHMSFFGDGRRMYLKPASQSR